MHYLCTSSKCATLHLTAQIGGQRAILEGSPTDPLLAPGSTSAFALLTDTHLHDGSPRTEERSSHGYGYGPVTRFSSDPTGPEKLAKIARSEDLFSSNVKYSVYVRLYLCISPGNTAEQMHSSK